MLASGSRTMSDSLMPFQPLIELPSNMLAVLEQRLVDDVGREGHVVLDAAHVGEAQVDELDLVVLDQLFDFVRRHVWNLGLELSEVPIASRVPTLIRASH